MEPSPSGAAERPKGILSPGGLQQKKKVSQTKQQERSCPWLCAPARGNRPLLLRATGAAPSQVRCGGTRAEGSTEERVHTGGKTQEEERFRWLDGARANNPTAQGRRQDVEMSVWRAPHPPSLASGEPLLLLIMPFELTIAILIKPSPPKPAV